MDITQVEKDETERQRLIKLQPNNGRYYENTGVYKYSDKIVYDLLKTNGEIGLGWLPIRGKIIRYLSKKETDENNK